jgi:hypothetical protein
MDNTIHLHVDARLRELPTIAAVCDEGEPARWQADLLTALRSSGLCSVVEWHGAPAARQRDTTTADAANPAGSVAESAPFAAILDLTGRVALDQHLDTSEGIWRLCDAHGILLGDERAGLRAAVTGEGTRVNLIALKETSTRLIDSAAAFANPSTSVSLQRQTGLAANLLLGALREIVVLGALDPRPRWQPAALHTFPLRNLLWKMQGRWNRLRRRVADIFYVEQWMIGVVEMPIAEAIQTNRLPVRWIGDRAISYYWADPFGVPGSNDEVYCEEYDVARGTGRIVKLTLDGLRPARPSETVDLGLPGHLSYPYLFEHGDALYCVAESSESGRCVLNRLDADGHWTEATTLLNQAVADPSIFEHGGYFWLAYTDVSSGAFDNLCLSYAEDLLGPWHPHPQNPVKIDHHSARPAGSIVKVGSDLYRLAQVCATAYGQGVAVNRILHCTPTFYREQPERTITPESNTLNPHGLHTMSAWNGRTLVDGKRHAVNFSVVLRKVESRVRRLASILARHSAPDVIAPIAPAQQRHENAK